MTNLFVIDNNILLSGSLFSDSKPSLVIDRIITTSKLVFSDATFAEFVDVIFRKKFDKYFFDDNEKWQIIYKFERYSTFFVPTETITDCPDPKDNKFLELAVECKADCIISGDSHLLDMHPFRNIPILNAADFLSQY